MTNEQLPTNQQRWYQITAPNHIKSNQKRWNPNQTQPNPIEYQYPLVCIYRPIPSQKHPQPTNQPIDKPTINQYDRQEMGDANIDPVVVASSILIVEPSVEGVVSTRTRRPHHYQRQHRAVAKVPNFFLRPPTLADCSPRVWRTEVQLWGKSSSS